MSFIRQILEYDSKVGSIGTIEIYDGDKNTISKNTTPESLDIQRNLNKMIANDCKYCIMEVSSHALVLNRVDCIDYKIGVFTNLTQDHLDFHKNIENYKNAKERLFYKTRMVRISKGGNGMYESSPTEKNQKKDEKEQIMKKIRQLENQQKILLNRQSDMERRARTRRLIEHGAILESVFPILAALPDEEVKAFLLALSRLPEAAELLKNTVENETTE